MPVRDLVADRRALTEATGIAILVGFTVAATAVVGLNVLVVQQSEDPGLQANFTYEYVDQSRSLLIAYDEGDDLRAGNLTVEGPSAEATWAALADVETNATVEPGAAVQLSDRSAYGRRVLASETITIYYDRNGNRTEVSQWTEEEGEFALRPAAHPLTLHTGNVLATLSPMPRASETRTTSSTSL